jgi:hypothetical protein
LGVNKKENVKVNITNEDGSPLDADIEIVSAGLDLWDILIVPKNEGMSQRTESIFFFPRHTCGARLPLL